MTLALFALAALAAAAGTRLAAGVLVGAAVAAALSPNPVVAVIGTWTAVLGAGAILLARSPRRLALPIAGAAAAVVAGAAPNAAAVLALWALASLALVATSDARRSSAVFVASDLPFVVAVITGAVRGFQGWPSANHTIVALALFCTAAAKVALADASSGPDEPPVLLVVRTQALVAAYLAVAAAPHAVLQAFVVAGALAFAVVPHLATDSAVDLAQEVALFGVVLASGFLGWGPRGWAWAVVAAGTLIHHLRMSTRTRSLASVASLVTRGGLVGFALLPVVVAELEGVAYGRPAVGAALIVTFVYGLAARSRSVARARLRRPPKVGELAPLLLAAAAFAAGIWAPFVSLPRPPAGLAIGWFPAWAALTIAAAAVVGFFFPGLVKGPARAGPARRLRVPSLPVEAALSRPFVLEALVGLLVVAAAGMWVVGAIRGFL